MALLAICNMTHYKLTHELLQRDIQMLKDTYTYEKETNTYVKETEICVKETYTCVKETDACVKETYKCVHENSSTNPPEMNGF